MIKIIYLSANARILKTIILKETKYLNNIMNNTLFLVLSSTTSIIVSLPKFPCNSTAFQTFQYSNVLIVPLFSSLLTLP